MLIIIIALIFIIAVVFTIINMRPYMITGGFGGTHFRLVDPIENLLFFLKEDMRNAIKNIIANTVPTITTVEEIPQSMSYRRSTSFVSRAAHIGQLKLFLSELQFLTEVLDAYDQEVYVIYAGSAPGNKLGILHEMFPRVKFILVDPHDHLILYGDKNHYDTGHRDNIVYFKASKTNIWKVQNPQIINTWEGKQIKKIEAQSSKFDDMVSSHSRDIADYIKNTDYTYYIIEDYYTADLSHCLKHLGAVYFISDIRSKTREEDFPSDIDIVWNNSLQMEWLDILRPKKAMLKFVTPYFGEERVQEFKDSMDRPMYRDSFNKTKQHVDFVADYIAGKFRYYQAEKINLQAFAGTTSSETRSIISDFDKVVEYDPKEYEDKMFYYNKIMRDVGFHDDHREMWDRKLGIDACGDCALMCKIFREYYTKLKKSPNPTEDALKGISHLMSNIQRTFFVRGTSHGYFYKQYDTLHDAIIAQRDALLLQYVGKNYASLMDIEKRAISLEDCIVRADLIKSIYNDLSKKTDKEEAAILFKYYYTSFILKDLYRQPHQKILRALSVPDPSSGKDLESIYKYIDYLDNKKIDSISQKALISEGKLVYGDTVIDIDPCKYSVWSKYATDEEIVKNYLWFYQVHYKKHTNLQVDEVETLINKIRDNYKEVYELCDGLIYSTLLSCKFDKKIKTLYPQLTSQKPFSGHIFDDDIADNSLIFARIYNSSHALLSVIKEYLLKLYKEKNVHSILVSHKRHYLFHEGETSMHYYPDILQSVDLKCEKFFKGKGVYISLLGINSNII